MATKIYITFLIVLILQGASSLRGEGAFDGMDISKLTGNNNMFAGQGMNQAMDQTSQYAKKFSMVPGPTDFQVMLAADWSCFLSSWKITGVDFCFKKFSTRFCLIIEHHWPTGIVEVVKQSGASHIKSPAPMVANGLFSKASQAAMKLAFSMPRTSSGAGDGASPIDERAKHFFEGKVYNFPNIFPYLKKLGEKNPYIRIAYEVMKRGMCRVDTPGAITPIYNTEMDYLFWRTGIHDMLKLKTLKTMARGGGRCVEAGIPSFDAPSFNDQGMAATSQSTDDMQNNDSQFAENTQEAAALTGASVSTETKVGGARGAITQKIKSVTYPVNEQTQKAKDAVKERMGAIQDKTNEAFAPMTGALADAKNNIAEKMGGMGGQLSSIKGLMGGGDICVGNFGPMYPRRGFVSHFSDTTAAYLAAMRTISMANRGGGLRVMNYNFSIKPGGQWQQLEPLKDKCRATGGNYVNNPGYKKKSRSSMYMWAHYPRVECCSGCWGTRQND